MIPSHCKHVGKLSVEGPITRELLEGGLEGRLTYKLTEYYCITDGEGWAVIEVEKAPGARLLVPVEGVRVLSLPDSTAYVEDPRVDTTNPAAMLEAAERVREWEGDAILCVVVQGEFNHLSFVLLDGSEVRVRVLDVVPPYPSKVLALARRALDCTPLPVVLDEESVDLAGLAADVPEGARLLFPCRASGLELGREVEYLDETPPVREDEDLVLVGCQLSERIYHAHYGMGPPRTVTMCPLELAHERGGDCWTLVKCCKEKGPFAVHDRVFAVPWSASKGDVAVALREIVKREQASRQGHERS